MKVQNFISNKGNRVANQFIIWNGNIKEFQSYESTIIRVNTDTGQVTLDEQYWDYSNTTGKYRNQFLNETKRETQKKIDSGEYKLENLN